jgi:hypothetical protein
MSCPWHATRLKYYMALCLKAHPLCTAVSYNPGMLARHSDCDPKNELADNLVLGSNGTVILHSAVARVTNITTSCEGQRAFLLQAMTTNSRHRVTIVAVVMN